MSNVIQDLLRDPSPVMILDMELGSREQGFADRTTRPAHDPEPLRLIAGTSTETDPPRC